ncbi:MAG: hypothetical protein U9N08_00840 [Candidatus Caldatribacteriota bacterium]|nr:hypothetical protein [Candidatus Caldatribacteriota bacterium]
MKKLKIFLFFIILFFLIFNMSVIASTVPGLQIDYHDNASLGTLVSEQTSGYNLDDREWRPVYLNDKNMFKMPRPKDLWSVYGYGESLDADKYYYDLSLSRWKNSLPGESHLNWPANLFISNQKPSSLWQKFDKTLYYQINNHTVSQPLSEDCLFQVENNDRYAFSGTIDSSQLPGNYFQDPMKKMLLENFLKGSADNSNIWSLYDDMVESLAGFGTIHPLGTLIFLAMEYWLIVEYESLVRELEAQSGILSDTPAIPPDMLFRKYYDPISDKNFIIRVEQPNDLIPSGTTQESTGFSFLSPEASGSSGIQQKVVSVNKSFTSANIPFKFLIQLQDTSSDTINATSRVRGRFFIRLYYPDPDFNHSEIQMREIEIAGINSEQEVNPWAFLNSEHYNSAVIARNNVGKEVGIDIRNHALPDLALSWEGNIAVRAMDFGVDHFEKIEFGIETEIPVQDSSVGPVMSTTNAISQSHLSVYPLFFRNIAQAGLWTSTQMESAMTWNANSDDLPEQEGLINSFEWIIEGEEITDNTASEFSHTFSDPGDYEIWLKVDPEIPSETIETKIDAMLSFAEDASYFNDNEYIKGLAIANQLDEAIDRINSVISNIDDKISHGTQEDDAEDEKSDLLQLLPFLKFYEIFNDSEEGISWDNCPTRVESGYEFEIGWQLPPCFALNTSHHSEEACFPGRSSQMKFWVTNYGSMDYDSQENDATLPPLEIIFFIDRNDDLNFSENELVWSEELEGIASQASSFFNVEEFFFMDTVDGIEDGEVAVYLPGKHLCQCQVTTLSQEIDQENNSIQQEMDFVISPELAIPDFSIENACFNIDDYRNLDLYFFFKESSNDFSIAEIWRSFYPEESYNLEWGPINYDIWIKNEEGYEVKIYSGIMESIGSLEGKAAGTDNLNLYYVPAGDYYLEIIINQEHNPLESNWNNNSVILDSFNLEDNSERPWYTRGGDTSRSYWKNGSLKPPLITDWTIETSGIPVAMVCNEEDFFVLTTEGKLEKYHADGLKQYSLDGFDGHPIDFASLLLVYPGSSNEKMLIFGANNRLKLLDTQDGNLLWTSQEEFFPTVYGKNNDYLSHSKRCLDYNGQFLLAAWPLTLYSFNETMDAPELLWQQEEKDRGEVFLLGQKILAGQRIYSLELEGEEIDRLQWVHQNALRFQEFIYSNRKRVNFLNGQVEEIDALNQPKAQFENRILNGNTLQCFDNLGNALWEMPKKIPKECYLEKSAYLNWNIFSKKNSIVIGNQEQGFIYMANQNYQLMAFNLESGMPVWYREFVTPHENTESVKNKIPDNIVKQLKLGSALHQTPLNMAIGFAYNISDMIPFQDSLLVGTFENKIYRLSSSGVDRLEVRGTIPSKIYRSSNLKLSIASENESGSEVPLEDKIMVMDDGTSSHSVFGHYYQIGNTIELPLTISDKEKLSVEYPEEPYAVSKQFQFTDVQMFSSSLSVPLEIDNILSIIKISKKDAEAGKITSIALNSEAELSYKPKREKNKISLYYNGYGSEDVDCLIYPHGYQVGVSRRSNADIPNIFQRIILTIFLPEEMQDTSQIKIKVNGNSFNQDSALFWIEGQELQINCLQLYAYGNEDSAYLKIYLLKE